MADIDGGNDFIYGVNPAFEVIRSRRRAVVQAWISETGGDRPRMVKLSERVTAAGGTVHTANKHQLFERSGTRQHQGVVVEVSHYPYVPLDTIWASERILFLDNVEDPQNTGAILRSAEGLGFKQVVMPLKGVPPVYPSVVKASAGATEHMQIHRCINTTKFIRAAVEQSYHVAALDAKGKLPLPEWHPPANQRLLLVIGGEDKGVGQFILNSANTTLSIPSTGRVTSYNASVSAALAMYQAGSGKIS